MRTITKTLEFTELQELVNQYLNKNRFTFNDVSDGYEAMRVIHELSEVTLHMDIMELSKKYLAVEFDTETGLFIFMKKSYIEQRFNQYLKTANETTKEDMIELAIVTKMIQTKSSTEHKTDFNDIEYDRILRYENIMTLINDINNNGITECYYDTIARFLETIVPKYNMLVSDDLITFIQSILTKKYPKEELIAILEQKEIKELEKNVLQYIQKSEVALGIDRLSNRDDIITFIVSDIIECSNVLEYSQGDIQIGMRRFIERDLED